MATTPSDLAGSKNSEKALRALHTVPFLAGALLFASSAARLPGAETAGVAFRERSSPTGSTLFTELPPDRTGIVATNRYDDPRMWSDLNREYQVGAFGTGIAIGDYDGDGRPDVFIVSKVESGRLFRNLGDWRFADVTAGAGLEDDSRAWKQGAAFADVNNDGRLDLYICRFDAPNQLFINQGDGTFRDEAAARGVAIVDASGMACFADYDRDGWLDFYLQTNLRDATLKPEGQRDYLFRNKGDGMFSDVTDAARILAQGTQGHSATWWDYDEDGWLDLYVANDFDVPDFLYRNNRDGTFANVVDRVFPHIPFSSMGSDIGDADGDGRLDLFSADMAGTTHERTQRGVANQRAQLEPTLNERVDTAIQLLSNVLYLNTGTGRCMEAAHLAGVAGTDWTWSTRFEDLDNDGRIDLFVTNGMEREQINVDLVTRRLAALSPFERIAIMKRSPVMKEANLAYANRGDLRFEEVGRAWGLDKVGVSLGAAFGDLDGDGDLDLVFTNYQEGPTVLRNDSQHGNAVVLALRGTVSNRFGVGARVTATTRSGTQVRQLVLARGYLSTSEPVLHFGFGHDEAIESLRIEWPSGRVQTIDHLPVGRRYTFTEPEAHAPSAKPSPTTTPTLFQEASASMGLAVLQREEPLEGTVSQPLLPRRFNRRGPGLAVGDLDGDRVDEIVIGGTARDAAKILRRSGDAFRSPEAGGISQHPALNDGPPLVFDANGDGFNDLLLTGGGAALPAESPEYEPRLWLNDGRGAFTPAGPGYLPSLPISVGAAVAADFNRDGKLDLFLGGRLFPGYYPEPPTSALLLQQPGKFVDATEALAPDLREAGLVISALATDVDDDGWIDLVVALEWGGIRCFRNAEGDRFEDLSRAWGFDAAGSGLWTSIAASDFNHDGRLDYAVGNLGLNTEYTASRDHPLRLFTGDFAASGEPQLVEALDLGGSRFPLAGRRELSARIPAVLRRFPVNDRFAAAPLEEVLGAEALARATVYTANELRSGVLLSQPAGGFTFAPLPRAAQISPIQGTAAADFDGDGNSDLLLVNNDYSAIPARGRWDGGLGWVLRGDGQGGFKAMSAAESGWLVPGNAKGLALIDLDSDGRPDAIVTRNNQTALAFRLSANVEARHVAIRLHGRAGNPGAIGARVTLERGGRVLHVAEIHAGGGYASQSTSTAFASCPENLASGATVHVRWPSGESTEAPLPAANGYLDLAE